MNNMILLVGKPCSGKDVIKNELIKMGMKNVISYTTRPKREGEVNGTSYHFITEEEFLENERNGVFAETTSYKVASGETWYYGSAKKDLTDDKVMIVSPYALKTIKNMKSLNPIAFYVLVNDDTIFERIYQRGDNKSEIERRLRDDAEIFRSINEYVDFAIRNDGINLKPRILAEMIMYTYKKVKEEKR